jgi:hypothetical protein
MSTARDYAAVGTFTDSTDILGDRTALRERINNDSYLFFRGLVDPSRVEAVRSDVLHALQPLGWLAEGSDADAARPGEVIVRDGDDAWWPAYTAVQSLESYHRLAHDPAILGVVRALTGDEVLVHPRKIARVTFPGSEFPTPAHQDFPLIQGAADTFTVWMPFGSVTPGMGGLRLLRGSHLTGLMDVEPVPGVGGVGVRIDQEGEGWLSADYHSGDVLIMHSFSVHWAPPNRGDRLRLSTDYRYQTLADPVAEGSLLPHGHPTVPGWAELTAGWSSTTWVDAPKGVHVVEVQDPMEAFSDVQSRFARPSGRT